MNDISDNDLHSLILSYEVLAATKTLFAAEVLQCLQELQRRRAE